MADSPQHSVIVVQVTALASWLALKRSERRAVITQHVEPAVARHPECSLRWVDAEAMTAVCSDMLLVETDDLRSWNHLWERLRDTDLFAKPYFALESIVVGVEDGFKDFENSDQPAG